MSSFAGSENDAPRFSEILLKKDGVNLEQIQKAPLQTAKNVTEKKIFLYGGEDKPGFDKIS